jgi:hypothetical protein
MTRTSATLSRRRAGAALLATLCAALLVKALLPTSARAQTGTGGGTRRTRAPADARRPAGSARSRTAASAPEANRSTASAAGSASWGRGPERRVVRGMALVDFREHSPTKPTASRTASVRSPGAHSTTPAGRVQERRADCQAPARRFRRARGGPSMALEPHVSVELGDVAPPPARPGGGGARPYGRADSCDPLRR